MSKFESIFGSNTDVDPNLNDLFSKKIERKPDNEAKAPDSESKTKKGKKSEKDGKKIKKFDPETEKRTIFIGNLVKDCKKEDLLKIFKSYGKIETVRFRNVVPEDLTKPKKYAYITKQIHPNKQTINAFVRFKDEDAAKKAAEEMNGMEFKSNHLRVDLATRSKVHDNKKSVFLGGLPFDASDEDVYSHFSQCGPIEFVRLIRDNKTGIGKGFGYVQFKTADNVALALRLDGTSLNDRKIRVNTCVKKQKESKKETTQDKSNSKKGNPKQKENKFQTRSDKVIQNKKKNDDSKKEKNKDKIPKVKNNNLTKSKKRKLFKKDMSAPTKRIKSNFEFNKNKIKFK